MLGYAVRSGRSGGFCIAEDELQECGGTLDRMGALAAIQPDLDLRDTSRQLCTHSVGTEDVRAHSTDRILLEGNVALAGKQAVKYESELLPSGPGRLSRYDSRHPGCLRSLWSSPDLSFHQARLGQQLVHGFRRTCCNMIALQSESECAVSEAKSSGPSSDSFFRSASRRWTTPPPARSPFRSLYTRRTLAVLLASLQTTFSFPPSLSTTACLTVDTVSRSAFIQPQAHSRLTPISSLQQAVVAVATAVEVRLTAVELAVTAVAMAVAAAAATVRLRTIRGLPRGPTVGCHRQRTR